MRGLVKGRDLVPSDLYRQSILVAARERVVESQAEGITRTTAKAMVRERTGRNRGLSGDFCLCDVKKQRTHE